MRKKEIVSLVLVLLSIAGFIITFQLEIGPTRQWVSLLSLGLLISSMSITRKQEKNRVARVVGFFFVAVILLTGIAAAIVGPFLFFKNNTDFAPSDRIGFYVFEFLFWLVVVVLILSRFSALSWLERRVKWLTGKKNVYKAIHSEGRGKEKLFIYYDEEAAMHYIYHYKTKYFYFLRAMFTNPSRHSKEYGERKYQFFTRMEQTRLPLELHVWPEEESCILFKTMVRMSKKDATKDNVRRIRDVMLHLAKDDYQQPVYLRFTYDDCTLYLETIHGRFERVALVDDKGLVEPFSYQGEDFSDPDHPVSQRLVELLCDVSDNDRLYKVSPQEIVDADTFNRLWESKETGR